MSFSYKNIFTYFSTVVFFSCFILIFPTEVAAKSYQITQTTIDATLSTAGAMNITENRTYVFEDSYTFAYQYINTSPNQTKSPGRIDSYQLENFKLCDQVSCYKELTNKQLATADDIRPPDTFYVRKETNRYYIKWFYHATNETKKFALSYTVKNAITLQSDVAELYWQWIGADWEVAQGPIIARLHLPSAVSGNDVQAWSHGPLDGGVSIPDQHTMNFYSPKLLPSKFFEGRVVMPKIAFTAGATGTSSKDEITAQEQKFISDTENEKSTLQVLSNFLAVVTGVVIVLNTFFFYKVFKKFWMYGKDARLPQVNQADTLWEPPSDIDPAQIEQLFTGRKQLTPQAFSATILSLIHDRFFKIVRSDEKKGFIFKSYRYYLEQLKSPKKPPSTIQQAALSFLGQVDQQEETFSGNKIVVISLDYLVDWIKSNRISSHQFFMEDFPETVFDENLAEEYFDATSHLEKSKVTTLVLIFVLGFGLLFLTITAANNQFVLPSALGMIGVLISVVYGIIGVSFQGNSEKLTKKGGLETAQWKAFKKHISDYKLTQKYPIDSIILWEKYLVYGTALGVSKKVLEQLPIQFSTEQQTAIATHWGSMSSTIAGQATSITDSLSSVTSALSSVSSASSSSYGASGVGSSGGSSSAGGGGGAG